MRSTIHKQNSLIARYFLAVAAMLALVGPLAQGDLYNDGGVHNILSGLYGEIIVDNPPPAAPAFTTVNFGGTRACLMAFNNSQVAVNGGEVGLYAYDNSQVTIVGGLNRHLEAYGNSQVTMNGGHGDDFYAYDNSQVTINGGHTYGLTSYGNSQVTMNGGYVEELFASGNSQLTKNGGQATYLTSDENSQVTVNGGRTGVLEAYGNSQVTVVGSDFAVYSDCWDGTIELVFSGYGDLSIYPGYLWGTLANGDLLKGTLVLTRDDGLLSFVPVPAPGAVLLGSLGLSFSGWLVRRRRASH